MREIRARERCADHARAAWIDRAVVADVRGIADIILARSRDRPSVPPGAGGIDAVEHVDAAVDAGNEIAHGPDAHQVTRFRFGQERRGEPRERRHLSA